MINILLRLFLLFSILLSHKPDGNIWGIYIQDAVLKVGDFWASVLIVILSCWLYYDLGQAGKEHGIWARLKLHKLLTWLETRLP